MDRMGFVCLIVCWFEMSFQLIEEIDNDFDSIVIDLPLSRADQVYRLFDGGNRSR